MKEFTQDQNWVFYDAPSFTNTRISMTVNGQGDFLFKGRSQFIESPPTPCTGLFDPDNPVRLRSPQYEIDESLDSYRVVSENGGTAEDDGASNINCQAMDSVYNPETKEVHVVCAGFPSGCAPSANLLDRMEQNIFYYRYTISSAGELTLHARENIVYDIDHSQSSTDACAVTTSNSRVFNFETCGASELLRLGKISDIAINQDGVVAVELTDDVVRHIGLLDRGPNNMWGPRGRDKVNLVYTRFGSDLGKISLNRNSLVFADSRQTFQPEMIRISLDDLNAQRETYNDQVQTHPYLTEDRLFFIDYRYSTTFEGQELLTPAITVKQTPRHCDLLFKVCPDTYVCDEQLGQCIPDEQR